MSEDVKKPEAAAEQNAAPAQSGTVPNPAQPTNAAPDLNVSDLNAVKSTIDIATQRGAFRANELEAVGKTYNKLTSFLDHVTKQQEQQQEQSANAEKESK